jgi:hypothetical protein
MQEVKMLSKQSCSSRAWGKALAVEVGVTCGVMLLSLLWLKIAHPDLKASGD